MATITGTDGNDVLQATAAGGDTLLGLGGNDVLIGAGGGDLLNGGAGADNMIGAGGADTYIVDDAGDTVTESDSAVATGGIDLVRTSVNFTLGANVENLFARSASGGQISANVVLNGNALANSVFGSNGNDVLYGGDDTTGTGATATGQVDTLQGGAGNDTYIIRGAGDDVILDAASDTLAGTVGGTDQVIVVASAERTSFTLGGTAATASIESIIASDAASTLELDLAGNAGTQTIVGNAGANELSANGGADTLIGLGGNDIYNVTSGLVRVNEDVNGGFDEVNITGVGATTNTNTAAGVVTGLRDYDFSGSFVERIAVGDETTGAGNFLNITGNSNSQYIGGNAGFNVLTGNGGADTLEGFDGSDTYVVDSLDDVVIENTGNTGTDRVIALGNYALARTDTDGNSVASGVEILSAAGTTLSTRTSQANGTFDLNALSTSAALNNYLVGDAATSQTIFGSAGNNILDGFRTDGDPLDDAALVGGADTLVGLGGSDTYRVYDQTDVVVEDTGGGFDWIYTSGDYSLRTNQTSAQTASFIDENGVTRSFGATGGNYLSAAGQMQIEILSAANQQGTETDLTLEGNGFGQIIVGNFANNTISDGGLLTQQAAADFGIAGGSYAGGQDQLAGLRGDDTYNVTAQSTTVNEDAGNGRDVVNVYYQESGGTFGLIADAEVEFLNASLAGNGIALFGNRFNQVITGNTGDDAINGGGGQDTLVGGVGSDVYTIDGTNAGNVSIIEFAADDVLASGDTPRTIDRVNTSVSFDLAQTNATYTNAAGTSVTTGGVISVEQIVGFGGGDININGNGARQFIVGTTGNNSLNGDNDTRTGNTLTGTVNGDTMQGLTGNDSYRVYSQADVALESDGQGTDIVFASGTGYTLYQTQSIEGLSAANQSSTTGMILTGNDLAQSAGIIGTNGADQLWGRGGNDVLTGRGGSDIFGFAEIGAGNADTITDFSPGDFIGLSSGTFGAIGGDLAADEFVNGTQAVDGNDFIIYNQSTGQLFYDADANGSAASAILFATITPGTALGFNDFQVIGAPPATQTFTGVDYDTVPAASTIVAA